jgi:hypothetical protein
MKVKLEDGKQGADIISRHISANMIDNLAMVMNKNIESEGKTVDTFTKGNSKPADNTHIEIDGKRISKVVLGNIKVDYLVAEGGDKDAILRIKAKKLGVSVEALKVEVEKAPVKSKGGEIRDAQSAWRTKGTSLTNDLAGIINFLATSQPNSAMGKAVKGLHEHIGQYPKSVNSDIVARDTMIVLRQRIEDGMLTAYAGGWEGASRRQYEFRLVPSHKSDGWDTNLGEFPMYQPVAKKPIAKKKSKKDKPVVDPVL